MGFELKAGAKINWSLAITGRRPNGYHELDMLMQSIDLGDSLFFEEADGIAVCAPGEYVSSEENIVTKAAALLRNVTGTGRGARITVTKNVPVRAGLGGGSADCAAALVGLNRLWKTGLSLSELSEIGLKLGADVPFCLHGGLMRVRGIGEILEPVANAPEIPLLLLHDGAGLSTAEVFRKFDENPVYGFPDTEKAVKALLEGDFETLSRVSGNCLEEPAKALNPKVAQALTLLKETGAPFVRMSGSGSAVFAALPNSFSAPDFAVYTTRTTSALSYRI